MELEINIDLCTGYKIIQIYINSVLHLKGYHTGERITFLWSQVVAIVTGELGEKLCARFAKF